MKNRAVTSVYYTNDYINGCSTSFLVHQTLHESFLKLSTLFQVVTWYRRDEVRSYRTEIYQNSQNKIRNYYMRVNDFLMILQTMATPLY